MRICVELAAAHGFKIGILTFKRRSRPNANGIGYRMGPALAPLFLGLVLNP